MKTKIKGRTRNLILSEAIFRYINKIKIPSMPNITPPTKLMTPIKLLIPTKKRAKGKKQVIAQAIFFLNFKSYQKTFFRVKPQAIKEVKVVKTPKKRIRETIAGDRKSRNPTRADSVVWGPVIPKIR